MRNAFITISVILLLLLSGCGKAIQRSESAQAIADYQVKIDQLGKKVGAVLLELETDSNALAEGKITDTQMVQKLEKKLAKLRTYQQELNQMTPPPIYAGGHNYMKSGVQKTITALEMMRQGILNQDISQIETVVNLLTEVGEDVMNARTSLATATQQVMPGGISPRSAQAKPMTLGEYKTFMKDIDNKISGTLQMIDQSIEQFRQQQITKQDFAYVLTQSLQTMQTTENAFINAMPPQQFSKGHIMVAEGITYLKDGTATMKQAVEQSNDAAYQKSVQQFSTGIQKIQAGNAELSRNL